MPANLEEKLRQYYAAWTARDIDQVIACFTTDATFEDLAFAARFDGVAAIRSFVESTYAGAPDFRVEPQEILAGDGSAAAAWVMSGTHAGDFPGLPATGRRFTVRASSLVWFEGGLIRRIEDYWNPLEFARSVGLLADDGEEPASGDAPGTSSH